MGIVVNDLKLLLECRSEGASFEKVLTLGRLSVNVQRHDLEDILVRHNLKPAGNPTFFEKYGTGLNGDDLFRLLGARQVDSMDNSTFEGASIIHDLNQPLPAQHENQFDMVFDGGTLEHVFNFPLALHNAMRAVKPGGRLFISQIASNDCGHGFYCFSPELFYRALAPAYGFEMEKFVGYEMDDMEKTCQIPDNGQLLRRVLIRSKGRVMIMVVAKKIGDCSQFFQKPPQQFDYEQKWNEVGPASGAAKPKAKKPRKHSFLHDIPWYARWQTLRQYRRRQKREMRQFSLGNTELFKPYKIKA